MFKKIYPYFLTAIITCIVTAMLTFVFTTAYNASLPDNKKLRIIDGYLESLYYGDYDKEYAMEQAYKGYVASVGDPYTEYFTKEELQAFNTYIDNSYCGIGVSVRNDTENDVIVVEEVFDESPAKNAGIESGDIISVYPVVSATYYVTFIGTTGEIAHVNAEIGGAEFCRYEDDTIAYNRRNAGFRSVGSLYSTFVQKETEFSVLIGEGQCSAGGVIGRNNAQRGVIEYGVGEIEPVRRIERHGRLVDGKGNSVIDGNDDDIGRTERRIGKHGQDQTKNQYHADKTSFHGGLLSYAANIITFLGVRLQSLFVMQRRDTEISGKLG